MRAMVKGILAVMFVLWLSGCQAMTGETAGQNIDDTTITSTVKGKLAAEKVGTFTRIGVNTNVGVVQLTGIVNSADEKAHAEEVARNVSGVKRVVNNLQVQPGK
jgi:hyperosmotically inducible periplasmic protein